MTMFTMYNDDEDVISIDSDGDRFDGLCPYSVY